MTLQHQSNGDSGALFIVDGAWPINSTVAEDIYFFVSGSPMDLTGLSFKLTLRSDALADNADYTLSTDDATLVLANDSDGNHNVLQVSVTPGTFSTTGDYTADLASKDASDVVVLWAHGTITLRKNPVTW